jgi:hypothetical protein
MALVLNVTPPKKMSSVTPLRPLAKRACLGLFVPALLALGLNTASAQTAYQQSIIEDQWWSHSAIPRDAPPEWRWQPRVQRHGRLGDGNLANPWGQVYEMDGNRANAQNTRVQIKDLVMQELFVNNGTYIWYKTHHVNGAAIKGAAFPNDYSNGSGNGASWAPDLVMLKDGVTDRPSVRVGRLAFFGQTRPNYNNPNNPADPNYTAPNDYYDNSNFHFYPSAAKELYGSLGVDAFFVTCKARLVKHGPTDDRGNATYCMGVGSDWLTPDPLQPGKFIHMGDNSIGRHKKITTLWQTFRSINFEYTNNVIQYTPYSDTQGTP